MKLKELRQNHNLTQQMVAEYLHCSAVNYSRYETGERQPSIEILAQLADLYHVSLDYLVGRERSHRPSNGQSGRTQVAQNSLQPESAQHPGQMDSPQRSTGNSMDEREQQDFWKNRADKNLDRTIKKSQELNLTLREAALIEAFRNADPRARNDSLNLLLIHDARAIPQE